MESEKFRSCGVTSEHILLGDQSHNFMIAHQSSLLVLMELKEVMSQHVRRPKQVIRDFVEKKIQQGRKFVKILVERTSRGATSRHVTNVSISSPRGVQSVTDILSNKLGKECFNVECAGSVVRRKGRYCSECDGSNKSVKDEYIQRVTEGGGVGGEKIVRLAPIGLGHYDINMLVWKDYSADDVKAVYDSLYLLWDKKADNTTIRMVRKQRIDALNEYIENGYKFIVYSMVGPMDGGSVVEKILDADALYEMMNLTTQQRENTRKYERE